MSLYRIVGGDVGTKVVFVVREWPVGTPPVPNQLAPVLNIASATSLKLVLIPPAQTGLAERTVTATLYTDGMDGSLQYTTVSGDIPALPFGSAPQLWRVRPQFTLGGWSGKGEPDTLFVDP